MNDVELAAIAFLFHFFITLALVGSETLRNFRIDTLIFAVKVCWRELLLP